MNNLTESGVYKLVFKSRKPSAEKFSDWVTDEVLPALREKGSYSLKPQENQSYPSHQKFYKGIPVVLVKDVVNRTGLSRSTVRAALQKCILNKDYWLLKGVELAHFRQIYSEYNTVKHLFVIAESGVKKLSKILGFKFGEWFATSIYEYEIVPKTFEGEPVLFYEDIMALTGLSCRQIDEYVLTEARKAPLDGICILTVYGFPKFKEENPHLKKYLEKEKLVSFIKKKGAISLLKGCGCSKRDVKRVMDYYNQNVSIETNTIYNLDYQKLFVQLDISNRNKVLNTMIQLYDEQIENENKVKLFSKKQNKNMLLSTH